MTKQELTDKAARTARNLAAALAIREILDEACKDDESAEEEILELVTGECD